MKNVADITALSPMQKLMLLHARTASSGHDLLFNQIVYEIRGSLDQEAYHRAWQLMVDRHTSLRTLFVWQDGKEPLQIVRESLTLPWTEEDWSEEKPAAQQRALHSLLAADREQGFDVLHPPLMRLTLIKLSDERSWLVWSSHHLIIDRWCISILFEELQIAYDAFRGKTEPALLPAPRFRDYIAWLAEQDEAAASAYWRESLAGLQTQPLPLQPALPGAAADLAQQKVTLDNDTYLRLRRLSKEHNLTLSTLVNGAWALLLSGVTGATDVLFGLTVSGRPAQLPRMTRAVGSFINNVPLRVTLNEQVPLLSWLGTLQERQLSLQDMAYVSPAQIQNWSDVTVRGQLFDSLVVFQVPVAYAQPGGLHIQFLQGGMQTGYPLTLGVVPVEDELRLTLTYDRQRVPLWLVKQIIAMLPRILDALPESPDMRVLTLQKLVPRAGQTTQQADATHTYFTTQETYVPPRTAAEQAIYEIWTTVLDLPHISIEERFFDLGGDSVKAIHLLTEVEKRFGADLPITLLLGNPSLAEMAEVIAGQKTGRPADPVLLPINSRGSRPPFFYAHGVFGDISSLTNIVPLLPEDQPLYGLQALGLQPNHEPDQTLEKMAAHYVSAMQRVQPHGPYQIGGFCFGGVLAYEIAYQLEQLGEETTLLAIIEGSAPRQYHTGQPLYSAQRLQIIRHSVPHFLRGNQEFGGWRLRQRLRRRLGSEGQDGNKASGRDKWDIEFDNLADYNTTRPAIQHKLRDINVAAIEQYDPRPYGGKITLFRGRFIRIGHALLKPIDPRRGWGNLARGGVDLRYVDGSHIGVLRQPHARHLAQALTAALQENTP